MRKWLSTGQLEIYWYNDVQPIYSPFSPIFLFPYTALNARKSLESYLGTEWIYFNGNTINILSYAVWYCV